MFSVADQSKTFEAMSALDHAKSRCAAFDDTHALNPPFGIKSIAKNLEETTCSSKKCSNVEYMTHRNASLESISQADATSAPLNPHCTSLFPGHLSVRLIFSKPKNLSSLPGNTVCNNMKQTQMHTYHCAIVVIQARTPLKLQKLCQVHTLVDLIFPQPPLQPNECRLVGHPALLHLSCAQPEFCMHGGDISSAQCDEPLRGQNDHQVTNDAYLFMPSPSCTGAHTLSVAPIDLMTECAEWNSSSISGGLNVKPIKGLREWAPIDKR